MENDYSQLEIDNIINELLNVFQMKLMHWEINALHKLAGTELNQTERDWLIGIYDRIGEASY